MPITAYKQYCPRTCGATQGYERLHAKRYVLLIVTKNKMRLNRRMFDRKNFGFVMLLVLILFSCNTESKTSKKQIPGDNQKRNFKNDLSIIDNYLNQIDSSSQYYVVSGKKSTSIKGRKGTILYIVPSNLETEKGLAVFDSIKIELKELHTQKELVLANAQTVSEGKLLESGGAYYINLSCGKETLRIKKNKSIKVEFPKISDKGMSLFDGKNDSLGNMNWFDLGKKLGANKIPEYNLITIAVPPRINDNLVRLKSGIIIEMEEWEYQVRIRRNDPYLDSSQVIRRRISGGFDRAEEEEIKFIQKGEKNNEIKETLYKAVEIKKLGWINCDRFYEIKDKTNLGLAFNKGDNIESAVLFIVFKDINSVMKNYFLQSDNIYSAEFKDIPVGQKVKLISITTKKNEIFTFQSDIIIEPNKTITINYKKSNLNNINSLFDL